MQKQYTLEIRCDFADPGRFEAFKQSFLHMAKHALAEAQLLASGDVLKQKPQCAVFADDFFSGHDEIDAMEDVIAKAEKDFGHLAKDTEVSSDLAEALRDLREQEAGA